jgi:CBS domain-containing protein
VVRVHEVMQADAPLATVPGNRVELLHLFAKHNRQGFAVVKQGTKKLAGLVLRADLLRHPHENQTAMLMNPNASTMYAQAHLQEAARLMVDANVPILPVVTGSNDVVGVISTLDILEIMTAHAGRVQAHLRRHVVPIHQGTPAIVAKEILDITGAPALPVLDPLGRLTGIVTDFDLLQRASVRHTTQTTTVGIEPDEDDWNREGLRNVRSLAHPTSELQLPDVAVERLMVRKVISVNPLTPIGEAAQLMVTHGIHQVPVVDPKGKLLDLLTDLDVVAALR